MARSGSTTVNATMTSGGTVGDALQFKWSVVNTDVANNRSTVSWQLVLISYDYGLINSVPQKAWNVTINEQDFSGTANVGIGNNTTKTLASGTVIINHNSDGSKTFNYSFSQVFDITFNGWVGTVSGSGTGVLNTIPRATTPTLSDDTIDMGQTLSITLPRASNSFTHTLQHDFHAGEWTTFAIGVTTSTTLTPPLSWADRIPWQTSGTCRIRCITYNGSTQMGSTIVQFTAVVPDNVKPFVSNVAISEQTEGLASKFNAYIQGQSKIKVTITGTGARSSLIQKYAARFDGDVYNERTFTTDVIKSSGTVPLVTTVTDSRKRQGTLTTDLTVLAYEYPRIKNFRAYRSDSEGVEEPEGNIVTIALEFDITPLDNKNDKIFRIYSKRSDSETWDNIYTSYGDYSMNTQIVLSDSTFDVDYDYQLKLEVEDYFKMVEAQSSVSAAYTLVDYHSSGKGISFGKVAQREGLDCYLDSEFFNKAHFHNLTYELIYLNSSTLDLNDISDSGEYYVAAALVANCPSTQNGYLSVRKYNDSYCIQTYTTYTNECYERIKAAGTWRAWVDKTFVVGVIEEGTSGIWRYRKWSNGFCELWGKTNQISVAIDNSWGNIFTCGDAVKSVAYPFTFKREPHVTMSPYRATNNNFGVYTAGNGNPTKQTPAVSVWRGSSSTNTQVSIEFYVYGELA